MKLFPRYGFFIGLLLLSHSLWAQYSGGNGGGHAMAAWIQFDDAPVANNPQVLYKGGNGGGHAFAELILDTTTVVPNNPQRLYVGGVGGGHSFSALLLDTIEVVLQNPQRLYAGGIGGGHAFGLFLLDTVEVVIQNPQKLYLGGIGGGYALAQTYQDTNMVVPQNPQLLYRGGIGGGHDLDTSTQSLVVKDCISPPKPSAQSVTLCAGAVFNGIQVPALPGHFIRWYTSANGGTATLTTPTVSTAIPGIQRIYATYVNDSSTCESGRTAMEITISAKPTSPVVSNVGYCIGANASALTATATVGHTLKWYADATTSTALATAPVPSTSLAGTAAFYVSQVNTATGCESDRAVIIVTVSAKPLAPIVANISYCQGATASALTATATAGHTLKWYADATTSTALAAAPVPSTSQAGTAAFYVSQVNTTTGCESDRSVITVTVSGKPLAPVVANISYCQGATASALTATATAGHTLKWYADATTSTALAAAPVPSTSQAGTTVYYVSQVNTATGCESERSVITVTVSGKPLAPVVANISYCQGANASALTATATAGHTLKWYADATTSTALAAAPVPSTSQAGTTVYYVSQVNTATGCESERSVITVTVSGKPLAPVVANISYCQGANASALTATATAGHTLKWYSNLTTSTALAAAPVPSTSQAGTTVYYVSQVNTATGCESERSVITVTVSGKPLAPVVANISYCQGANASALTATATAGHTLKWYSNLTTSTALAAAPVPSTSQAGTAAFYVSQVNTATGCESERSVITVTVSGKPLAPVVANISYCQGATASALTATATAGHTLKWYADATTSTALAAAPVPSTSQAGTVAYYVSQVNTTTGCESDRVAIIVTVNTTQPPVVAAATWCQQAVSTALTATVSSGHRLNWYGNSATGGSGSNTAPVPSTSVTGTFDFYVSQTNLASGCESMRSKLTVTIYQTPEKPVVTRDANANLVSSVKTGLQWLKDQVVINGAVDSIFKPSVSGNYSVRHTQNGCTVFSQDYYYMTTALVNLNNDEYIEIFPNPFQSYLQINFKLNRLNKPNLKVYEASGKLIYEETQVMPGVKLNTSGWINGSYRIVISTATGLILYTGSVVK